jgi:hypothetical protein
MEHPAQEPRRIWWARPHRLCALERPGGGGRNHRVARRAAEIAYLCDRDVRLVVSVMRSRHNLADYEAAGLDWHHVPVRRPQDEADVLEEVLPLLREELRLAGAVALHGDSHTDFAAALCAVHLHELCGADLAETLDRAARAGLSVTPQACALLGVDVGEVMALRQAA